MAATLHAGKSLFVISRQKCYRTSFLAQSIKFLERNHPCIKATNRSISVKIPQNVVQESLSDSNRQRVIKQLKVFEKSKPFKLSCPEEAAVLVPLCIVDNKPSLLFTLRSSSLVSHRGQVSFPGGKRDKEDRSLVDTAVRETVEEIGIKEDIIDVWGSLPAMPDRKGKIAVTSVVSFLGEIEVDKIPFNHDEVSLVFTVSVENLCDPKYHRYTDHKLTDGTLRRPVFLTETFRIWGLTGILLDHILVLMFPGLYGQRYQRFFT